MKARFKERAIYSLFTILILICLIGVKGRKDSSNSTASYGRKMGKFSGNTALRTSNTSNELDVGDSKNGIVSKPVEKNDELDVSDNIVVPKPSGSYGSGNIIIKPKTSNTNSSNNESYSKSFNIYGKTFSSRGLPDSSYISKNYYRNGSGFLANSLFYETGYIREHSSTHKSKRYRNNRIQWDEEKDRKWRETTRAPYFENKIPGEDKVLPASAVVSAATAFGLTSLLPLNVPPNKPLMYCSSDTSLIQTHVQINHGNIYGCISNKIKILCQKNLDNQLHAAQQDCIHMPINCDLQDDEIIGNIYCANGTLMSKSSILCINVINLNETVKILKCYEGEFSKNQASFIPTTTTTQAPTTTTEKSLSFGAKAHIFFLRILGKHEIIEKYTTTTEEIPQLPDDGIWIPEALTFSPGIEVENDINTVQIFQDNNDTKHLESAKKPKITPKYDKLNNTIDKFLNCFEFEDAAATINTNDEYQSFNFFPEWASQKSIWTQKFEKKFGKMVNDENRPPLHVVIMPHSHNDPGWLKTFEGYFQSHTKHILDNVVKKLPGLDKMTFIWTEICFLELWWKGSNEEQRNTLRKLIQDGRVEITTGGWVMTDEATAHIYAMVDQLVEGHQWVKTHLNVTPTNSWSIDPFGHGSTMPYLLGTSDFEGAIIQRIHYGWKEWLASRQYGDFIWRPSWNTKHSGKHSLLTHNMPFDMYFVDMSCGPQIQQCKPYDFRWFGNIHDGELQAKADQLIGQYQRSASLYPHNVFLAIVGGDFRYEVDYEFDSQYNYKKIIDYVNANPKRYNNATLQFGTPKDYFKVIKERVENYPTLAGDFFPYVDVFTNGKPGYWTGYYTTRPFLKIINRDLEHNLRNAEILFSLGLNKADQTKNEKFMESLRKIYPKLVLARRNLGLFQHHDGITGTSKAFVMDNYLDRMFASLKDTIKIQQHAIELFMQTKNFNQDFLSSSLVREISSENPKNLKLDVLSKTNIEIVLFNSLAHERLDIVTVHVTSSNVEVVDSNEIPVPFQINSIFRRQENSPEIEELAEEFELIFLVKLSALSLTKYFIRNAFANSLADSTIYSGNNDDDIQVENSKILLSFDKSTGFLKSMSRPQNSENEVFQVNFGAYQTSKGKSGAYLFKPDDKNPEIPNIFNKDKLSKIIVIEGEIASYVKVFYGKLLTHTVRILKTDTHLDEAIYLENNVNMNDDHSNFEIFMRLKSPIKNGKETEFFTDLNGFQWQRRKKVSKIGVEGNYYPITVGAFIQDERMRLTLLTSHAQGATSPNEGELEVMLDRRTPTDDERGVQEGVTDNLETIQKHWIILEFPSNNYKNSKKYQVPTIHASTLSNMLKYPVNVFVNSQNNHGLSSKIEFLKYPFPCDIHLFNLRTLTSEHDEKLPTRSSLLIVNRMSYDCKHFISNGEFYNENCEQNLANFDNVDIFSNVNVNFVQSTSLTGLKNNGYIKSFNHDEIEAMEIRTFNMTFH